MGDRSTAEAGFIGEDAAFESHQHHLAEGAAGCRFTAEGIAEDQPDGPWNTADVDQQHHDAGGHVQHRHQRHDGRGGLGNPFDSADDHSEDQNTQHDAGDHPGNSGGFQGRGHLKHLNAVADAEAGEHAEHGKESGQPAPALAEAVADVIHRAAHMVALVIGLTEVNRQEGLGVFGGDAEHGNHPHPEHGAWAAHGNGTGDTGNVAGADGGGEGSHQRLERRDLPFVLAIRWLQHHPYAIGEPLNRHEAQAQHQHNACDGDQADGGPPPHQAVDWTVDLTDSAVETLHPQNSKCLRDGVTGIQRRQSNQRASRSSKRKVWDPAGVSP